MFSCGMPRLVRCALGLNQTGAFAGPNGLADMDSVFSRNYLALRGVTSGVSSSVVNSAIVANHGEFGSFGVRGVFRSDNKSDEAAVALTAF